MATSRLDAVYRSILITKFFTKGWGKPDNLRRLFEFRKTVSSRDDCFKLVEPDYPVTITKEETTGDCRLVEGHFLTPLERFLPGIVPPAAQKAHFQALIPLSWPQPDYRPMCLHLAGTGDHHFWRRRQLMAKPLLKEASIGGIILENPFYGLRKPSDQVRSSLHNVSDIFVMGGCLILESLVLFHWCERNNLGPLGVTGLSMGGHMASLAATNWPKPLVLVPCLSWSTASAVFLQGVMSHSINWDLLEDQYLSDGVYREKLSKLVTVVDAAFLAGKKFAQKVSRSVSGSRNQAGDATDEKVKTDDTTQGKCKTNDTTQGIVKTNETTQVIVKTNDTTRGKFKTNDTTQGKFKTNDTTQGIAKTNDMIQGKVKTDDTTQGKIYASSNIDTKEKSLEHTGSNKELEQRVNDDNGDCSVKNCQTCLDKIKTELANLSRSGQISESLYVKLISNEKFELDSRDVEELNKLNREKILSHLASKYSVGSIRNNKSYSTVSSKLSEETDDRNARNFSQENNGVVQSRSNVNSDETNDNVATKHESIVEKNDLENSHSRRAKLEVDTSQLDRDASKPNIAVTKDASCLDAIDPSKPNTTAAKPADDEAKSETTKLKDNKTEKKSRNITEVTQDIFANLPFVNKSGGKKIDISKIHWRDREALQFMRGIMDECTHLSNFSVPFDTSLIIAVCAKHDAYVPREDVGTLEEIWPGAEVRYVDAGHVSAYLLHQSIFRSCIIEAFERSKKKWKDGKHIV